MKIFQLPGLWKVNLDIKIIKGVHEKDNGVHKKVKRSTGKIKGPLIFTNPPVGGHVIKQKQLHYFCFH